MMQISGFLKCADPSSSDDKEHPKSLGLIAECRPIESMSIIELAIQRSSFTTTTTLDLKFTAVESRYVYSKTSTSVCTVGPLLVCVQWDLY